MQTKRWERTEGKAYYIKSDDTGRLKVSFFGPFYGAYNIIALDNKDYRYALVCGPRKSCLWLLAREPAVDKSPTDHLQEIASTHDFDTSRLIFVKHKISNQSAVTA